MSCREWQKGAPITAHRWRQDRLYRKLQCVDCGCGLSEEGVEFLATRLQAERDELLAYEMDRARTVHSSCQHKWTGHQIRSFGCDDFDVLVICAKCDGVMELGDFIDAHIP